VLNELSLWSEITSEHPLVIKTLGKLTNKNIPQDLLKNLSNITIRFQNIKKRTEELESINPSSYMNYGYIVQIRLLVDKFLKDDRYVITTLSELRTVGREDKVWQTLLEHITEEQKFMYETFSKIKMQIGY
jgi:hypothetical protein